MVSIRPDLASMVSLFKINATVPTAGEKAKKSAVEKMEEKTKENLDKLLPKKD